MSGDAVEEGADGDEMEAARSLMDDGDRLAEAGDLDQAVRVYDEVYERFAGSADPDVQSEVTWALSCKANVLHDMRRYDEAVAVYAAVVTRCSEFPDVEYRRRTAEARINMAHALGLLNRRSEELEQYDQVATQLESVEEPQLELLRCLAWLAKGRAFAETKRFQRAVDAYELVLRQLPEIDGLDDDDRELANASAASALARKARALAGLGLHDDAMAAYHRLEEIASGSEPATQAEVVGGLVDKADILLGLGENAEALVVCQRAVDRFGDCADAAVLKQVACALVTSAVASSRLNRVNDAHAALNDAVRRFGDHEDHEVREIAASAQFDAAKMFMTQRNAGDAAATFEDLVSRFEADSSPVIQELVDEARIHYEMMPTALRFFPIAVGTLIIGFSAAAGLLVVGDPDSRWPLLVLGLVLGTAYSIAFIWWTNLQPHQYPGWLRLPATPAVAAIGVVGAIPVLLWASPPVQTLFCGFFASLTGVMGVEHAHWRTSRPQDIAGSR